MIKKLKMTSDKEKKDLKNKIIKDLGNKDLYVFGYGSLIWNPGFNFISKHKTRIQGYKRAFCQWNNNRRGTDEVPGLVLALEEGDFCDGISFLVEEKDKDSTVGYLINREIVTGAYIPILCKAVLENKSECIVLTFIMNKEHPKYAPNLTLDDQAKQISISRGDAGTCYEYMENTYLGLVENNIKDSDIDQLMKKTMALI